jgi:hypothetical protein
MTIAQMHDQFDLGVDERNNARFTPPEKDEILNRACWALAREYSKEFESNEEFRQSLAKLVEVLPVTFTQTLNTAVADLDSLVVPFASTGSEIMFILSLNVQITDNCGRINRRAVRPHMSNDEVHVTNDPFNQPSAREPKLHMEHNGTQFRRRMRLYVDGDNGTAPFPVVGPATVRVLRTPRLMNISSSPAIDCELPAYLHQEIVNKAVSFALENVSSDRLAEHSLLSNEKP